MISLTGTGRIKIHGLPAMANHAASRWQGRAAATKKWKAAVARELVGLAPPKPWSWLRVEFIRHSSVEPDYDGLVHGFKPLRDALVKFGFVKDDAPKYFEAVYKWEKAKARSGFVEIVFLAAEL